MTAKERVKEELGELRNRLKRLNDYIRSDKFQELDNNSQALLVIQSHTMSTYEDVLGMRLENWKE